MTTGPPNETSPDKAAFSSTLLKPCQQTEILSPFLAFGGDWGAPPHPVSHLCQHRKRGVYGCLSCDTVSMSGLLTALPKLRDVCTGEAVPMSLWGGFEPAPFPRACFFFLGRVPLIGSYQSSSPGKKARWSPHLLPPVSDLIAGRL